LRMADGGAPNIPIRPKVTTINSSFVQYTFADPLLLVFGRMMARPSLPEFVPTLLDPKSLKTARNAITNSDLVQIETMWMFDWVQRNTLKRKPMVLWEEDVVCKLHQNRYSEEITRIIREKEERAVTRADAIVVVSKEDQDTLCSQYEIERSKIHFVPHGIDTSEVKPPSEREKTDIKAKLGFSGKTVVLFTGCSHFANAMAIGAVRNIATKMRRDDVLFLVAGTVGERVQRQAIRNVRYTGYVTDIRPYFRLADIAINPVLTVGGVNTKMIEYLAYGLPTVTTSIGLKGLSFQNGKHVVISSIDGFPEKIEELASNNEMRQRLGEEGRMAVQNCHDLQTIGRVVLGIYRRVLAQC